MKISIVFPYNTWGGAFRSTYELSNRMISKGHEVKVYIPSSLLWNAISYLVYQAYYFY